MIKNDRQLAVAQSKQTELLTAAATADNEDDAATFRSLADDLGAEIREYASIVSGEANLFHVTSIDDLAEVVVKARLARGWTQKQLADELGVAEQMVQRDEAGGYARAGLGRLADAVDALGYQLVGELRPAYLPETEWQGQHRVELGEPFGMLKAQWTNKFVGWMSAAGASSTTGPSLLRGSIESEVHMMTPRTDLLHHVTDNIVVFSTPRISPGVLTTSRNKDVSTREVEAPTVTRTVAM